MWMKILVAVVIGAIIGWIASKIMKSKNSVLGNIILGILGSALGGFLGGLLKIEPSSWILSMILAIACACLLLWLYKKLFKGGKR